MKSIKYTVRLTFIIHICFFVFSGCSAYKTQKIVPTFILQAMEEIPEKELMDVGVVVFDSVKLTEEKAKEEGTHRDIRIAESHYMPYHLKNTLQKSSHWGTVRVLPTESDGVDIMVKGKIVKSNGERLILKIDVLDATGKTWLRKKYKAKATNGSYFNNVSGEKEAFQDLYNTITNDMSIYKSKLKSKKIKKIRMVSTLRFADNFAPHAFGYYLEENKKGRFIINRLPAEDDPMMYRILRIRERDFMFLDTLNSHYESFYDEMWPEYHDWRRENLTERIILRTMKREAFIRQAGGILMIMIPILLGGIGGVPISGALMETLLYNGSEAFLEGMNMSQQAEIHSEAIHELRDSFGSNMKPIIMQFHDKNMNYQDLPRNNTSNGGIYYGKYMLLKPVSTKMKQRKTIIRVHTKSQ